MTERELTLLPGHQVFEEDAGWTLDRHDDLKIDVAAVPLQLDTPAHRWDDRGQRRTVGQGSQEECQRLSGCTGIDRACRIGIPTDGQLQQGFELRDRIQKPGGEFTLQSDHRLIAIE